MIPVNLADRVSAACGSALCTAVMLSLLVISASAAAQTVPGSAHNREPVFSDLSSFYASLPDVQPQSLDANSAVALSAMALSCEDHPQPRPVTQPYLWVMTHTPVDSFETRRAFYGCYDWHSSVNSAWTLVRLLRSYPGMATAPAIRDLLNRHLGASNIAGEVAFFKDAGTYELPYGYAWLLRLQGELRSWKTDPDAVRWAANLQPLASLISGRLVRYLDDLRQPVRVGVHPNTAMAMDNALFYATHFDPALEASIRKNATRLFGRDIRCNTAGEPGPSDFASPCLYEATIMGKLLDPKPYLKWLDNFLPPIQSVAFRPETRLLGLEFAEGAHASVASTSHLVGLSLVRAMSMEDLANVLPPDDPRAPVLRRLAVIQAAKGLPQIGAVGYDGSHYYATWVVSYFAAMAGSGAVANANNN